MDRIIIRREHTIRNVVYMVVYHQDLKYWAFVSYDSQRAQFTAPAYGRHATGTWLSNGYTDAACGYVADWCARSTAYRRFKDYVDDIW